METEICIICGESFTKRSAKSRFCKPCVENGKSAVYRMTEYRKRKKKDMPIKEKNIPNVGDVSYNKVGDKITMVEYISSNEIYVTFNESDKRRKTTCYCFKYGTIKNRDKPSVYDVADIGVGDYKVYGNGKVLKRYTTWHGIIERCYSKRYKEKKNSYEGMTVCKEWLNYQNFSKWYDENYYEVEGERVELDKDILIRGNKIYSPDTCVFVPSSINKAFIMYGKEDHINEKIENYKNKLPISVYDKISNFISVERQLYKLLDKNEIFIVCSKCGNKITIENNIDISF